MYFLFFYLRETICKYAPWEVRWVGKRVALAGCRVEIFRSNFFSLVCANFGHFWNVAITYCARPRQPSPGWGHGCAAWRGGQRAMEGGWWLDGNNPSPRRECVCSCSPVPRFAFSFAPLGFWGRVFGFLPAVLPPPRSVFVFGLGLSPGRSPRGVTFSPQRFTA